MAQSGQVAGAAPAACAQGDDEALRLRLAQDAAGLGMWDWDLVSGQLTWDEQCATIFGASLSGFEASIEGFDARTHPQDLPRVHAALSEAIATAGTVEVEYRALWPDGTVRHLVARGQALVSQAGTAARVLGVVLDVTRLRTAADEHCAGTARMAGLVAVAHALGDTQTELGVLEVVTGQGVPVLGASGALLALAEPGRHRLRMLTTSRSTHRHGADLPSPADDSPLPTTHAARTGQALFLPDRAAALARFPAAAASYRRLGVEASAVVPMRSRGRLLGALAVAWTEPRSFDAADRELLETFAALCAQALDRIATRDAERAATAARQQTQARLTLLAEVGRVLSATLDIEEAIRELARLVVPALGDWSLVTVTDDQGGVHELGRAHRDPARRADLDRFAAQVVPAHTETSALAVVTRTGQPLIVPDYGDRVATSLSDPVAREQVRRLAPQSVATVPLPGRGRTLGALSLVNTPGRGPHTAAEVETAVEVGRRAGQALDNARLFGAQRRLSETLQRSLLTQPPQQDDLQVAVRYQPPAADAQVGGDWYDAFLTPDRAMALVVGDVTGHDREAAAVMGQVRNLLRATAYAAGPSPAGVLAALDATLAGLQVDALATAVLARVEPVGGGEADSGTAGGRVLRWCNAGHPPPLLRQPDGAVEVLERGEVDLLLGLDSEVRRTDWALALADGATLLLYTDGLVERRGEGIDIGVQRLAAAVGELGGLGLEELCDRLLDRLLPHVREDDVALLALRVRRA